MTEKVNKINNPLTIIAIFAALAEVNATIAIGLIDPELHHIFIWFVIGFPSILVLLFFLTLNFNTRVMYSPSDYQNDDTFMKSLYGIKAENNLVYPEKNIGIDIEELETKISETVNNTLSKLTIQDESVRKEISKAKDEILTETDTNISNFKYKKEFEHIIKSYVHFPAFFSLINHIEKNNISHIEDLNPFSTYLSDGWDEGVKILLDHGILEGELDNFKVSGKYAILLNQFLTENAFIINKISRTIKNIDQVKDKPDAKGKLLESLYEMPQKLQFK